MRIFTFCVMFLIFSNSSVYANYEAKTAINIAETFGLNQALMTVCPNIKKADPITYKMMEHDAAKVIGVSVFLALYEKEYLSVIKTIQTNIKKKKNKYPLQYCVYILKALKSDTLGLLDLVNIHDMLKKN